MSIKYLRFLASSALLLAAGCHSMEEDQPISVPPVAVISNKAMPPLDGKWTASGNIWLTGDLVFKPGGTFSYYTRGCSKQTFTEGNWYKMNNVVELKSFERYKDSSVATATNGLNRMDTAKMYIAPVSFRLSNDSMTYVSGDTILQEKIFLKAKEAAY